MAKNPSADPETEEFPKGPEIGDTIPRFTLPDQNGVPVSYDGSHKALVLFHRSADW